MFLLGCGLYALNRWGLKPNFPAAFLHGQFNDCLLIPCALPLLLWLQRKLGLRKTDAPPRLSEIALHLIVWSVVCEGLGPRFLMGTGDLWDVVAYSAGALVAWLWWQAPFRPPVGA